MPAGRFRPSTIMLVNPPGDAIAMPHIEASRTQALYYVCVEQEKNGGPCRARTYDPLIKRRIFDRFDRSHDTNSGSNPLTVVPLRCCVFMPEATKESHHSDECLETHKRHYMHYLVSRCVFDG